MDNSSLRRPVIDLRSILEYSDGTLSVIGIILNFLLLYLIITKTGQRLKPYRRILLQNCIVDIIYNSSNTVTRTQTDYKDGNFFLIMTSTFGHVPAPYNNLLICSWIFALYLCVTTLPVQFIYRYLLIVKGQKVSSQQYFSMLLLAVFPAVFHVCYSLYTFWPKEPIFTEKQKMLEADVYYYNEVPSFITADIRNWQLCGLFLYCYLLIFVSYTIVIWANYKVWKHLKIMEEHMTLQTKDAHQQMTKTLILQAAVPLIVCFFPIGVTLTMVFLRATPPGLGICVSLLLSWIPAANSTMTILAVKSYRNEVTKCFRGIIKGRKTAPIAPQITSTVISRQPQSSFSELTQIQNMNIG